MDTRSNLKNLLLGLLPLVFIFCTVLMVLQPDVVLDALVNITAKWVVTVAGLFGIPGEQHEGLVSISGYVMQINVECTSLPFLLMYSGLVLVYPRHRLLYKFQGIAFGCSMLLFINALRIVLLGVEGAVAPEYFEFTHVYLWQGLFGLLVFGIWMIWVDGISIARPGRSSCSLRQSRLSRRYCLSDCF